jgi:predicted enzyme related to lactoylglutathione lyase
MSTSGLISDVRAGVSAGPRPVVHLELHTREPQLASGFYAQLLDWQPERIETRHGCYLALGLGREIGGGIVGCQTERSLWLPYVEVDDVASVTAQASRLGAGILLAPREGPAGWRSVITAPDGGEIALWQSKEHGDD